MLFVVMVAIKIQVTEASHRPITKEKETKLSWKCMSLLNILRFLQNQTTSSHCWDLQYKVRQIAHPWSLVCRRFWSLWRNGCTGGPTPSHTVFHALF